MNFKISILSKCRLLHRDAIAAVIRHICNKLEEQGESESFSHQVVSAFNEAFNNLANHGGPGIEEKEVMVTIIVTSAQLIIEMEDNAEGFIPPPYKPAVEELRESGMGLAIINEFMDSVKYKKNIKDGFNSLRMLRNLTTTPKHV